MEILSPGQKIKKIRKELKIKQKDITSNKITRELISFIENDKSKLTPPVAEIITENIIRICKERNIVFNLTPSYLLEDVTTQANKVADKYLKFLCNNENNIYKDFTEDIKEIEIFLMQYDICDKKIIIYEKLGDIFKNKKDYNRSYTYYIKAFENNNKFFNNTTPFILLQKIGNICIHLTRYSEALDYNALALSNNNIPENLRYNILLNNILAYISLKNYDKALGEIQYIENTLKNLEKQDIIELTIEKANCYRWKKYFNDALDINKNILNFLHDSDNYIKYRLLVTSNILDIYTVLNDTNNIKEYIDKVLCIINTFDDVDKSYYASNAYRQIGISANLIGNIELSKKYYEKSIKVCKQTKNTNVLEKSLNEFLNILIQENNSIEIANLKNNILELIYLNIISKNSTIILRLIAYYNSINDNDSIQNLLNFILNEEVISPQKHVTSSPISI